MKIQFMVFSEFFISLTDSTEKKGREKENWNTPLTTWLIKEVFPAHYTSPTFTTANVVRWS